MSATVEHKHYEHYDAGMIARLDGGWGHVDSAINRQISALLPEGVRVLDIGCGFGSLTGELSSRHRAIGIDPLLRCLDVATRRYPRAAIVCGSVTDLPLAGDSATAVVLRDVLHHLLDEAPIDDVFAELDRVGVRQVVVIDPNPNPLLMLARRLIRHTDPVCGPAEATILLEAHGFQIERRRFTNLFSIALSGGYVGPIVLPGWRWLWKALLAIEDVLVSLVGGLGLGRLVCWRYTIVARRRA